MPQGCWKFRSKPDGAYKEGWLKVWSKDDRKLPVSKLRWCDATEMDARGWVRFDGTQAHETTAFEGERYTFVFYTVKTWKRATEETLETLRVLGVQLPATN